MAGSYSSYWTSPYGMQSIYKGCTMVVLTVTVFQLNATALLTSQQGRSKVTSFEEARTVTALTSVEMFEI